ncbi:MAG: IclR family transcriptional regulator [Actinomycetaceae bacterium]|nr:IclR family transcriptional regulator [Actinomycetaceae bacterium]
MASRTTQSDRSDSSAGGVQSVVKAVRILDCFSADQPFLTLSQICRETGLPKSTALNLVRTLEQSNLLMRIEDTQQYQLSYRVMEYSYALSSSLPLIQYAMPFLEEIQVSTGENIYLTSHIDGRVFYLECVYPSIRIGNYSVQGKTLPMHCTGCGKAMLAYLPDDELQQIVDRRGLPRLTPATITDADALREELAATRERGYALDLEEETAGVKCVAVAIRDGSGYPVGAISISGTTVSVRDDLVDEYARILSRAASVFASVSRQFPAAQLRGRG